MDSAGDVASRPLVLVPRVDPGHWLRAEDPFRHVLDVLRFEGGHGAPARLPRVHTAVESSRDTVETDSVQLAVRLEVLRIGAAGQHDRPGARDQASHPRAERSLQPDAVAPGNVAAVVVAPATHVDHGRTLSHQPLDL